MALYDSQYSLNQAYSPPTNHMVQPSGQKQGDFGKTLGGLRSLMGQQPLSARSERPAGTSDQDWQGYLSAAEDMRKYRKESGDMGRYIGVGEGGYDHWKNSEVSLAAGKEKYGPGYTGLATDIGGVLTYTDKEGNALSPMPPQQTINTSAGPMPTPTPMPTSTPMPGDVGYVPYGSSNNQPPTPMPTSTPMPGDVGYVPYGSSNNQPFVQGLAGGGPIRNLSFVELLKQIMEN